MNILTVKSADAINGPGIRCSIWTAGCTNRCKGCWSETTWDPRKGKPYTEWKQQIITYVSNPHLDGVAILGGDPFYSIMNGVDDELCDLLVTVNDHIDKSHQDIWLWTGYTLDELKGNDTAVHCLGLIDYIVVGRFDESLRNLNLLYRGSENQDVIDLKRNMKLDV